jgi:hypothetical protein
MRLTTAFLASSLLAALVMAQTQAPNPTIFLKGKAGAATAEAQGGPQFVKSNDGKWRCMDAGKPCSEPQLKAMGTIVKSKSNITNNLVLNPDGTLQCTNAGKPCSDADVQKAASELSAAGMHTNPTAR